MMITLRHQSCHGKPSTVFELSSDSAQQAFAIEDGASINLAEFEAKLNKAKYISYCHENNRKDDIHNEHEFQKWNEA